MKVLGGCLLLWVGAAAVSGAPFDAILKGLQGVEPSGDKKPSADAGEVKPSVAAKTKVATPAPSKFVNFGGQRVLVDYFRRGSSQQYYYRDVEKFLAMAADFYRFLPHFCKATDVEKMSREDKSKIRSGMPRASSAPTWSALGSLISEVRNVFDPRYIAYGASTTTKTPAPTADHKLNYVVGMISNLVVGEVERLSRTEGDDEEFFFRWVEFVGVEGRLRTLRRLSKIARECSAQCQNKMSNGSEELAEALADLLRGVPGIMLRIERSPKDFGAPEGWDRETGGEDGDEYEERDENADGRGRAGEDDFFGGKNAGDVVRLADENEVHAAREVLKRLVAAVDSTKGQAGGESSHYAKKLPVQLHVVPLPESVSLTSSVDCRFTLKAGDRGRKISSFSLTLLPGAGGGFWDRRKPALDRVLRRWFASEFSRLIPLLDSAVQLELQQRPVTFGGSISSALSCAQKAGSFMSSETLRISIDGITRAGDRGLLVGFNPEYAAQPAEERIADIDGLLAEEARQAGRRRGWSPMRGGGCELQQAMSLIHSKASDEVCLQYGREFDFKSLDFTAWAVCLGLYPPKTVMFASVAASAGSGQAEQFKRAIEDMDAQIKMLQDEIKREQGAAKKVLFEKRQVEHQERIAEMQRKVNENLLQLQLGSKADRGLSVLGGGGRARHRDDSADLSMASSEASFSKMLAKGGKRGAKKARRSAAPASVSEEVRSIKPQRVGGGRRELAFLQISGDVISDLVDSDKFNAPRKKAKAKPVRKHQPAAAKAPAARPLAAELLEKNLAEMRNQEIKEPKTWELPAAEELQMELMKRQQQRMVLAEKMRANVAAVSTAAIYCTLPSRSRNAQWATSVAVKWVAGTCYTDRTGSMYPQAGPQDM